jgi:hypothetical protein
MSVVFTGKTALWLWRSQAVLEGPVTESDRKDALKHSQTDYPAVMNSIWDVNKALNQRWCGVGRPSVLGTGKARQGGIQIKVCKKTSDCDLYRVIGATGTFVTDIGSALHICSEELDIDTCALLCNELCGTYGVSIDLSRPFFTRKEPRTTPEKLEAELIRAGAGKNGVCRESLRYVSPGSASPMESKLCVLFTLSLKRGGCSLPKPYVNQQLELTSDAAAICGKRIAVPDFIWPEKRLIIEYDSASFHTGTARNNQRKNEQDRARVNALQTMGYTVYSLEPNEVYDWRKFRALTMTLRKLLQVRWTGSTKFRDRLAADEHNKITTLLDPLAGTFGIPQNRGA